MSKVPISLPSTRVIIPSGVSPQDGSATNSADADNSERPIRKSAIRVADVEMAAPKAAKPKAAESMTPAEAKAAEANESWVEKQMKQERREPGTTPLKVVLSYWSFYVIIATPIILMPMLFIDYEPSQIRCAYVVCVMGVYWMTEAVPLAVTALLPMVLFPALGVIKSRVVAINYMKDTNFLFLGGLMVAVAVEQSGLHQRIALRVLLLVGSKPKWLLLGFMLVTWFLSMWISNTATTAMMLPITQAVLVELIKQKRKEDAVKFSSESKSNPKQMYHNGKTSPTKDDKTAVPMPDDPVDSTNEEDIHEFLTLENLDKSEIKLSRCLLLAVAYAANIGGTATLTGTPPNIVMTGLLQTAYGPEAGVSFVTWMIFAFPGAVLFLFLTWFWLQFVYFGWKTMMFIQEDEESGGVQAVLRQRYKKLGGMTWSETLVLLSFSFLVLLWLGRNPRIIPGWASFFEYGYMTDSVSAIFITFVLFVIPAQMPSCHRPRPDNLGLLSWDSVQKKFPWGIVILLGGGFALGDAVSKSGLSKTIGGQLESLSSLGSGAVCAISITVMSFVTGVTSNTATASIFIPILMSVSTQLGVHPLYLVLPVTVAASFSFILPVGTPPNAIVFGAGLLRVIDMMYVGFVLNIIGIVLMVVIINTYGTALFDLNVNPDWAMTAVANATAAAVPLAANVTILA